METEKWNNENPEIATIADIPISYGEIEEWRYKAGDPVWDIKPVDQSALKSTFLKCHNTLWDGGKAVGDTGI